MNWFVEHWIASTLLSAYVGVLLYNAYVGSKAATGVGGYYVGNREMGGAVVGISFFATYSVGTKNGPRIIFNHSL